MDGTRSFKDSVVRHSFRAFATVFMLHFPYSENFQTARLGSRGFSALTVPASIASPPHPSPFEPAVRCSIGPTNHKNPCGIVWHRLVTADAG